MRPLRGRRTAGGPPRSGQTKREGREERGIRSWNVLRRAREGGSVGGEGASSPHPWPGINTLFHPVSCWEKEKRQGRAENVGGLPESRGELGRQAESRLGNRRPRPSAPDQTRSAHSSDSQDRAEAHPSSPAAGEPGELTCTPGHASCSGRLLAGRGRPWEVPGSWAAPAPRLPSSHPESHFGLPSSSWGSCAPLLWIRTRTPPPFPDFHRWPQTPSPVTLPPRRASGFPLHHPLPPSHPEGSSHSYPSLKTCLRFR